MRENNVDVSIIIPVYNVEKYLHDCLNSVIFQTFKSIEIICIDDGSTDKSLEILKVFAEKDKRIKIFRNSKNKGPGAARNLGISKSTGKYISFLDSDDWIDENCIETCFEIAEKHNLDILMYKLINYEQDNQYFYKTDYYSMNFMNEHVGKIFNAYNFDNNLIFRLQNGPCNKFFLKSLIKDNAISFPEGVIHEDNPFFFKTIYHAKKIMMINEFFYNRRIQSNSITRKNGYEMTDVMEISDLALKFFIENNIYEKIKKNVINYIVSMYKSKFYAIDPKFKLSFYSLMKKRLNKFLYEYGLKEDFDDNITNYENKKFFNLISISKNLKEFNENVKKIKNKTKPYKISIIVPVYNANRNHLWRAFKSIKNQSLGFENLEIIFIDDNSSFKEGTNLIKELNDLYPNVKTILLNKNKGSGNARNIGMKNSTAPYIMFLDHDDLYLENACKILFDVITNEKADLVCGNYINITRDGGPVNWKNKNINEYQTKVKSVLDNKNIFKIDPSIWSKIYDKKFLNETNTYFSNFKVGQDLAFNQETLFKAKNIILINEPIVQYSVRNEKENSFTSISSNNSMIILKTLIEVYKYSYNLFLKYAKQDIGIPLNNLNYWVDRRLSQSNLSYDELKELINSSHLLFNKFIENKNYLSNKNNAKLYKFFSKKNYNKSYEAYQKLIM